MDYMAAVKSGKPAQPEEQKLSAEFYAYSGTSFSRSSKTDEQRLGYLRMRGPIVAYGDWYCYGANDYVEMLRYLNNDDSVSAIVIEIDGPGGMVSAINPFKDFAEEKKKPIVVLCDTLCSLHYWLSALIADHIMANGSISPRIGSIGAACIILDARKAMEADGYKWLYINAPGSELKNKAMIDFQEGKDEEFIAQMKKELAPVRDAFVQDVKDNVPNISSDERIFAADCFNATEALNLRLIQSIGNQRKAFELAAALADLQEN